MATSNAPTVDEYLAELPPDRRAVVSEVRQMIRRHIPEGYQEMMSFGMMGYGIPLSRYPNTYNKQPLGYVALAAQKSGFSLYLMCAYMGEDEARVRDAFAKAGKKLDMGKSCIRFKKLDDLPLDALGEIIASTPPEELIARYEAARAAPRAR
jgi:uncharacterized protein YdhG (YjbR/CyaY superfamily)